MIRIVAIVLVVISLSACEAKVTPSSSSLPAGSVSIISSGGYRVDAVPVVVDGVRCILVNGNGNKTAISCDWR